jgi:hypothetical protein
MRCTICNQQLPEGAKFCPNCGKRVSHDANIQVQQDIGTVKGEVAGLVAGEAATSAGLAANVAQDVGTVESGGTVAGAVLGGREGHVHVGGQQQYGDVVQGGKQEVHTEGGAYVQGNVTTSGGDFVGRDKITHGDEVHGDKVGGDKITAGDVSGTSIAIGRGAQASVTQGLGGDELAKLFAAVYQQIEARPEAPDVDKEELTDTVQKIQDEVAKGEQANPNKVERWLGNLAKMAPDILDVTVACLTSPAVGIATVIRKIAEKAKAEAGSA